jgi:hypothetical protein
LESSSYEEEEEEAPAVAATTEPSVRKFAVPSKHFVASIQGRKTEIVQFSYDDYILVIVTQVGKLGTLLHARKEEGYGTAPTFNVSIIMGKRDEVVLVDHPLVIVACPSLRASLGVRTSAVYYCYRVDTFSVS